MESNKITVKLGIQPREADIAFVSINHNGTVGQLNQLVIDEYSYHKSILKNLNLGKGYDFYKEPDKKPILFIVTVGNKPTDILLNENFRNAIKYLFDYLPPYNKIWIPLMGTGAGGLSYDRSYIIIKSILEIIIPSLNNLPVEFLISIPNNDNGKLLLNQIDNIDNEDSKPSTAPFSIENIIDKKIKSIENTFKDKQNEINGLINLLNANYYFVHKNWVKNIQTKEFHLSRDWKTGDVELFSEDIKNIKINDILIIEESYKTNHVNYLKIIAIGKVIDMTLDKTLYVNWIVNNLEINIKAHGNNNSTISVANLDSVKEIFSKINTDDFQNLKSSPRVEKKKMYEIVDESEEDKNILASTSNEENINSKTNKQNPNTVTISGIARDTDKGEDYLDIKGDVNAFARVIAAKSFDPPLAIALLGKWGSGKSFFMRKLKDGIQTLSQRNPEKGFCEGIAHVHFNAWSYMDANLWASIVTRIFEGLNEYIKNDTKANSFKKEIEKKLTQNLNIAKEEIATLEKQNENISAQIQKLNNEKQIAEDNLKDKIKSIRSSTIKAIIEKVDKEFKVNEQIDAALANNETFINSTNRLKKIVPEQYWMNPNELYKQLKSKYTFIKTFFFGENWWKNCLWLTAFLIIVLYTPIFTYIAALLLSWQDFTLTPKTWTLITIVGTALVRGIDTYKKLKTLIAPFWEIKENYETEKKNAIFIFNQEEKALQLEIENSKNEINVINEQINKAIVIKASIEFKLENALSTEALYSFIERRANSEDYKKHLGIVSIIRKDFEVLSDLLVDHKQEASKNVESKEFNEMFTNPLERIILYIDDLDRCPEERVVEVLEAVNLLMAFPLFVVVVGVDPRWVKTALQKKYQNQFTKEKENEDAISPSNYLEKIFQVPFHLKDAGDASIKNMIKTLAQAKPNIIKPLNEEPPLIEVPNEEPNFEPDYYEVVTKNENEIVIRTNMFDDLLNKETIEALEITENECELMQKISEIIGNNPRAVKRFVNIYRIIKTHEDFIFDNEKTKEDELAIVMLLLAIPIGRYKILTDSIEKNILSAVSNVRTNFDYFSGVEIFEITSNEYKLKKELGKIISKELGSIKNQKMELYKKHYNFIKRFTFKNI